MPKAVRSLVNSKWLFEHLYESNIRILNGTWNFPSVQQDILSEHEACHIPGASLFDIDVCSDDSSHYHHMLPAEKAFSAYVGDLGISNKSHVVVYDNHQKLGLFSAPRVWWMFRVFGHEQVSVLDGGLSKWIKEGKPVTSKPTSATKDYFVPNFQKALYKDFDEMKENLQSKSFNVLDARSEDRFNALAAGHYKDIPPGRMPVSVNVPYRSLLDPVHQTMLPAPMLQQILQQAGTQPGQPVTATCGTGITACLLCLAAHQCGVEDMAVYDGAWQEWHHRAPDKYKILNPPTEQNTDSQDREQ